VNYIQIQFDASYSCATSEKAGRTLYTVNANSPDWRGWKFEREGHVLKVTPPNRYCTTEIPLVHVRFMQRSCDPLPGKPTTKPAE
jgi:hypothetical protein